MTNQERDEQYVLHTYNRNYVEFEYGNGATLYDKAGKDYIDFVAGIAVCSVGHGNKKLAQAISEQSQKLIHISNLYAIEHQAKLAQKLIHLSGVDGRVFFCNSGAEANEAALKIARKYGAFLPEKPYKIITLKNSFHGRTISTLKATGQESMHRFFGPYPDGFVYAHDIEHIYSLLDKKTCAVFIELIQGEGGLDTQNIQDLQKLAQTLKEKEILFMVDEIQTGVYRLGEFLGSQVYGIMPDVVTLAKGLAGGVPIGAAITSLKDIFLYSEHGSTFGGNPLSTKAALSVLSILEEEMDSGRLHNIISLFDKELDDTIRLFGSIFSHKLGIGLMRGLQLKNEQWQARIIQESFKNRLLVVRSGQLAIRFVPPLTITQQELEEGFRRFKEACSGFEK